MNDESVPQSCPQCGVPVPDAAPGGLCPRCLLVQAAASTGGDGLAPDAKSAPSLEDVRGAFPQLEVLELVGQGGMGAVYKARQPRLNRLVALKILPERLAAEPAFAQRFAREGQLLARLNHPNIVAIYDFGESGGFYYLLMEFVDGVNLRQALRTGGFAPQQALGIVPKICEALQYAHDEGVLHRDIKPENILLDGKGRVKIADFGIAKFAGEPPVGERLTDAGVSLGTPHYMAPEQIERPTDVDHRADIYSLGVVFYELLTGELPLGRFAPPSEKAAVDTRVDDVVLQALEKERERRQQTAGEIKTQVETITDRPQRLRESKAWRQRWSAVPASQRRVVRAGIALLAMALLVCFAWPQRHVTVTRETLTFGLGQPWLTEVRVFKPNRQQWGELATATPAFAAGLLGMLLWLAVGLLNDAERAAGGQFGVRPADRIAVRGPLRWASLGLTALVLAAISVHASLLFCALFQALLGGAPPAIPTAILNASVCVAFLLVNMVRASRGAARSGQVAIPTARAASVDAPPRPNPWPRRIFWLLVAVLSVPLLLLAVWMLSRAPSPPATEPRASVKIDSATVVEDLLTQPGR